MRDGQSKSREFYFISILHRASRFEETCADILGVEKSVEYKRVACPAVLTNITNCVRNDDGTFSSAAVPSAAKGYSILMAAAALVMWMMS
jgi:hypothetical protein